MSTRFSCLQKGIRLYSSSFKASPSPDKPKLHKLSHLALSHANHAEFIKNNFMVKGEFLKFLDNARIKRRNLKLERRAHQLEFRADIKTSKSIAHLPKNVELKRENVRSRVSSAINDVVSLGLAPSPLIHPLTWKVASISVNDDATSAFINWTAIENSSCSKEAIEKAVTDSIPILRKIILKNLGGRNKVRLGFAKKSDEPELMETLLKKIEVSLAETQKT